MPTITIIWSIRDFWVIDALVSQWLRSQTEVRNQCLRNRSIIDAHAWNTSLHQALYVQLTCWSRQVPTTSPMRRCDNSSSQPILRSEFSANGGGLRRSIYSLTKICWAKIFCNKHLYNKSLLNMSDSLSVHSYCTFLFPTGKQQSDPAVSFPRLIFQPSPPRDQLDTLHRRKRQRTAETALVAWTLGGTTTEVLPSIRVPPTKRHTLGLYTYPYSIPSISLGCLRIPSILNP